MSTRTVTSGTASPTSGANEEWAFLPPDKQIGTAALSMIIFYSVSGGPFGLEGAVRTGGFLYSILGFMILPLLYSIPEALMTAELGSTFQEASGGVAWAEEAFGPAAGWLAGKNSLFAGVSDATAFLVLILDYILQLLQFEAFNKFIRFLLIAKLAIVLGFINWTGLKVVGNMSIILGLISLSPFLVMCLIGVFKVDPSRWIELPSEEYAEGYKDSYSGLLPQLLVANVVWRPFINTIFWNVNGFQNAAYFAGEVKDVGKTYPRALFIAAVLVIFAYMFPLLVSIGATTSKQEDWVDGYLATAAVEIGGHWLGGWVVIAAAISNFAKYQAETSKNALLLAGMAERGYIPKVIAERSIHGTPTYAIILLVVVTIFLGIASFGRLVEFVNMNYSISLLIYFVSFIKLRISYPNLGRPFHVPLGTFGCILLVMPPIALLIFIILSADYTVLVYGLATNAVVYTVYALKDRIPYKKLISSRIGSRDMDKSGSFYEERENLASSFQID